MQEFEDYLAEVTDNRTPDMIVEALETVKSATDKHFVSIGSITIKVLIDLITQTGQREKTVATKDGKWCLRGGLAMGVYKYLSIADSSNFMKNGTSNIYYIECVRGDISFFANLLTDAFKEAKGDIVKMVAALEKLKKEGGAPINVQLETSTNKHDQKLNPYSMIKNVKRYEKTIEPFMKMKRDDVIKMVVNGQLEDITVTRHLTDDYAFDGSGRKIDPIEFLRDDILGNGTPIIRVFVNKLGVIKISYSVHNNYSVVLTPNTKKVKVAPVAELPKG